MQTLSDAELLTAIQQTDSTAFAELVRRHSRTFFKLAYRYLNDADLAEDVVQEAFIKLWQNPHQWQPNRQTKFTTWFYRVIINRCLDQKKRTPSIRLDEVAEPADTALTQEQRLIEHERQAQVEQAINALPDRQRTALNLCFFEDLTNQQAAEIMGLKLKALQSLIMRAKQNLQKTLNT